MNSHLLWGVAPTITERLAALLGFRRWAYARLSARVSAVMEWRE